MSTIARGLAPVILDPHAAQTVRRVEHRSPRPSRLVQALCGLLALSTTLIEARAVQEDHRELARKQLQQLADAGHFSGVVEVWNKEGVQFRFESGRPSFARPHPVNQDTVFKLGSISKQFTAAAVLLLAEQGDLDLQESASVYLPDRSLDSRITVLHMLRHTSGIARDFPAPEGTRSLFFDVDSLDELLAQGLLFDPGTGSSYSNVAYRLLAEMVENVSEMSYGDFLELEIFEPLEMASTRTLVPGKEVERLAIGHHPGLHGPFAAMHALEVPGAGSLASTIADLKKWVIAMQDEALFAPETWKQMKTPVDGGYGCGLGVYSVFGVPALGHDGRTNGFYARLDSFADPRGGVLLLSNVESGVLAHFAESGVLHSLLLEPSKTSDLPSELEIPTASRRCTSFELAQFPGRYRVHDQLELFVRQRGNELWLRGTGGSFLPLLPIKEEGVFFSPHRNAWLRFDKSKPSRAIFWGDRFGKEWECQRLASASIPSDQSPERNQPPREQLPELHPRDRLYRSLKQGELVDVDGKLWKDPGISANDVAMAALWLHQDGEVDLAEQVLRAYAEHHPGSLLAKENLAEILSAGGKRDELREVLLQMTARRAPEGTQDRIQRLARRRLRGLDEDPSELAPREGLYRTSGGEHWSLRRWEFDFGKGPEERLIFCNLETGDFRALRSLHPLHFAAGRTLWPDEHRIAEFELRFEANGRVIQSRPMHSETATRDSSIITEELIFENPPVELTGTLHRPNADDTMVPAVVLVSGSGPQSRHGFGLATIADVLASHGIAGLRFDKRGTGGSTGHYAVAGFDDFASDALAAVEHLRTMDFIDPEAVGLWGISNGAWVVGQACAADPSVSFAIFVSGGGVSVWEEEIYNMVEEIRSQGHDKTIIDLTRDYARAYIDVARGEVSWQEYLARIEQCREQDWFASTVSDWRWVSALGARKAWEHEIGFDPSANLARMTTPLLVISGDLDRSHPTDANDAGVLRHVQEPAPTIVRLADTNHDMLIAKTGSQKEYPQLSRFSTEYFRVLSDWILEMAL